MDWSALSAIFTHSKLRWLSIVSLLHLYQNKLQIEGRLNVLHYLPILSS